MTRKFWNYLRSTGPLLVLLAVFIALKFDHLFYPYYWDESWSYAPGVGLMYQHGPTLLPGEIDTFYSRGHPLLFYASIASWLTVFGDSPFARHAFALFVSCGTLWLLYAFCRRYLSPSIALIASMLLAVQVMFFVQASYVLPEIMVALLCFAALALFAMQRYGWCAVALAALFLTKESGLVMGLVLGCAALMPLFAKNVSWKEKLRPLVAVLVAALPITSFFLLQRHRLGWFLYPEHTALIQWSWTNFYSYFRNCLNILFLEQTCYYFLFLLLPATLFNLYKKRYEAGILLIPIAAAMLVLTGPEAGSALWFFLWLVAMGIATWLLYRYFQRTGHPVLARMIVLTIAAFSAYLCFCALNFFTSRYLMPALLILVFWMSVFIWMTAINSRKLLAGSLFLTALAALFSFRKATGLGDVEMGSFHAMHVQQAMVDYLEKGGYYDATIGGGPFQDREHLTKPMTGFLKSNKVFTQVRWEIDGNTRFAFFNNIEPDDRYPSITADSSFHRVYRYEEGRAWTEIYERVR